MEKVQNSIYKFVMRILSIFYYILLILYWSAYGEIIAMVTLYKKKYKWGEIKWVFSFTKFDAGLRWSIWGDRR